MDTLKASTIALASNDGGDATYTSIEGQIDSLTNQRNTLATQIKAVLDGAAFSGQVISASTASSLTSQAQSLLDQAHDLGNP